MTSPRTTSSSGTTTPTSSSTTTSTSSRPGHENHQRCFEWSGTVEDYDEWLCGIHYGVLTTLREVTTYMPVDGDEGQIQGRLIEEMSQQLQALEEELAQVNRLLLWVRQRKHLEAAVCDVGPRVKKVGDVEGEKESSNPTQVGDSMVGSSPVLQTYNVPLQEVRANLAMWRPAILSEYESLTKTTKAVRPVHKDTLKHRTDVEYAPGKLVTTVKAPHGKMKARLVVCGNMVEASVDAQTEDQEKEGLSEYLNKTKSRDTYASGADAAAIRATLRHAGDRGWGCASIDVRTAFLLAPRRGTGLLAVRPPKILVSANICSPDERWLVDRALYGLQTSPSDWGVFRDGEMSSWTWSKGNRSFRLECTREPNLWRIKEKLAGDTEKTVGHILVYVDDMLVTGETEVIAAYLDHVRGIWQCSPPEWISRDGPAVKFCGFELKEGSNGSIQVSQEAYAKELVKWYGCTKTRPVPMSPTMASNIPEEKDSELDPKLVRQAQAITGEILWLALRTRPDLAFAVGVMGRHSTKNPGFVCQLGKEVVEYINGSTGTALEYGRCDPTDRGPDDGLPFPRSMRRLEAYADVSFAPQASRSIQGVLVLYGGSPIMWESSRQSCITLSTAEAELLSYVEAMGMADSMGCILEALEEVPCQLTVVESDDEEASEELYIREKIKVPEGEFIEGAMGIQRVIYGDNTAAISVASAPEGGAWRSRHLRLRSHFLRERLRHRQWWSIRHLPGSLLVADFLTKAISSKQRWTYFFKFLNVVTTAAAQFSEEFEEQETQAKAVKLNHEIIKIAAASLGFMATKAMQPGQPGSYDEKTKTLVLLWLWVYLKKRVEGLKQQGLLPMNPEQWKQELEKPGSTLKALRISERALSHDSDEKDFRSKLSSSEAVQLAHDLLLELPADEREGGLSDRDLKDERYVEEEAMIRVRALRLHPDQDLRPGDELALPADDALWDDLGLCPVLCQPRGVPGGSPFFPEGALHSEGALHPGGDLHDGGSLRFLVSRDDRKGSSLHLGGDLRDCGPLRRGASVDDRWSSSLRPGGGLCDGGLSQLFDFSPGSRHGSSLLPEGALLPTT